MISVGVVSGMLQGILQQRALGDGTVQVLTARSALEVRSALISSACGASAGQGPLGSFALYLAMALGSRGDLGPLALVPLLSSNWFAFRVTAKARRR